MNTIIIIAIITVAVAAIVYSILKSDKKSAAKATEVKSNQTTPVENTTTTDSVLDRQGTEPKL
jgi:flagellar basal body-associated protein FliL